ncbi:MAG: hypothetical protein ABEJ24_00795 [Candidatus Magasanikbacteria bacterium]
MSTLSEVENNLLQLLNSYERWEAIKLNPPWYEIIRVYTEWKDDWLVCLNKPIDVGILSLPGVAGYTNPGVAMVVCSGTYRKTVGFGRETSTTNLGRVIISNNPGFWKRITPATGDCVSLTLKRKGVDHIFANQKEDVSKQKKLELIEFFRLKALQLQD